MTAELAIAAKALSRWRLLEPAVQAHLRAFLGGASAEDPVIVPLDVPPGFAEDLALGGPQLGAAFPALRRTIVAIRIAAPLTVRILCEGDHDAELFGFMRATQRHVIFEEVHKLVLRDGRVAEDRVTLDVRNIIRQLVALPRRVSDTFTVGPASRAS